MSANTEQRKLAAIMFTDMVGYSALAQRDEALALELLEEHRRLLRSLFPRFNGREVKTIGDAFLVEFGSALEAAQCAIEIQRTLAKRNADAPADRRIQVRIGIHIGDVIHREGDVLGDGVNIASRIEPLAGAGGICISMDVERQIRHALEASLIKLPPAELKNIQVPMDLFRIVLPWEEASEEARTPKSEVRSGQSLTSAPTRTRWNTALVVLAAILAVGVGWWFYHFRGRSPRAAPAPAAPMKSLAVLPFENLSSDPENEYLSDGLTDELIITLQKVRALQVKGRASSFYFKGKKESLQRIGEQLQVSYLLEGSVSKAGDKLRVTADLISAADGFQLWATTYDRDMADILEIRRDVAQQVVAALKVRLGVEETQRLGQEPTENMEAYRLYLQGVYHWWQWSEGGMTNALRYFERAIAVEPNYAPAYAGMALVRITGSGWMQLWEPTNGVPIGINYAQKAIQLDPALADGYIAMGFARMNFDWEWADAQNYLLEARKLNPQSPLALDAYSNFLAMRGRFAEAVEMLTNALALDPFSAGLYHDLGCTCWQARQFKCSIDYFQEALTLDPNFHVSRQLLGYAYLLTGKTNQASDQFQTLSQKAPDLPCVLGSVGHFYGLTGRRTEAEQVLAKLDELEPKRYVTRWARAMIHLSLSETNAALSALEEACGKHDGWMWSLKVDPWYDPLRNEPRFQALVQKVENGGRAP